MRPLYILALVALVPAAVNPALAARPGMLAVPLCTGDGSVRTVSVPMRPVLPGAPENGEGCCAKGCHSGSSRKRGSCHN